MWNITHPGTWPGLAATDNNEMPKLNSWSHDRLADLADSTFCQVMIFVLRSRVMWADRLSASSLPSHQSMDQRERNCPGWDISHGILISDTKNIGAQTVLDCAIGEASQGARAGWQDMKWSNTDNTDNTGHQISYKTWHTALPICLPPDQRNCSRLKFRQVDGHW